LGSFQRKDDAFSLTVLLKIKRQSFPPSLQFIVMSSHDTRDGFSISDGVFSGCVTYPRSLRASGTRVRFLSIEVEHFLDLRRLIEPKDETAGFDVEGTHRRRAGLGRALGSLLFAVSRHSGGSRVHTAVRIPLPRRTRNEKAPDVHPGLRVD